MKLKDCKTKIANAAHKTADVVVSSTKSAGLFLGGVAIATVSAVATVIEGLLKVLWRIVMLPVDILFGFLMLVLMLWMSRMVLQEQSPRYPIRCITA